MKKYNHIAEQLKAEYAGYAKRHVDYIMDADEVDAERVKAYCTRTRSAQYDDEKITFEELKRFAIQRKTAELEKETQKRLVALEAYENATDADEIEISVEWHRSRTFGYNPVATVRVWGRNMSAYETGTASGCGYDKESAAVGEALNRIPAMRKLLCDMKEASLAAGTTPGGSSTSNAPYIAYGSGYGAVPYFEGGVGYSCFDNIFRLAGFRRVSCFSGKTYDCYRYEREEA